MKKTKTKLLSLALAVVVLLTAMPTLPASAAVTPPTAPRNLVVTANAYRDEGIGKAWYALFSWDAPVYPPGAADPALTFTFKEVLRGSGTLTPARTVALPSTATTMDTSIDISPELSTGTIYALSGVSSYKYGDMGQNTSSSSESASVRFLTGLEVGAAKVPGSNDIRIIWDDVWDTNGRINYQIMISETQGFSQPPNIPIIQGKDIGTAASSVTVNAGTGKLEYIWTGASPGREYIVKVIPLVASDVSAAGSEDIPTTPPIQTGILLFAQKVGFTETDVIWKFYWDAIASDQFSRVEYNLFRKIDNSIASEMNIATIPNSNVYFLTIPKTDTRTFSFKVEAIATLKSDPTQKAYFLSDSYVELRESIPEKPEAPVYRNFPEAVPPLIFEDLLAEDKPTLLWAAPTNGNGQPDTDITYDIFLTQNVDEVLDPQPNTRIASRVSMGAANEVRDAISGKVIGYRYLLSGLQPNLTYYVSMRANKQYLLPNAAGNYVSTLYASEPSTKVIITAPDAGANRPIAPPAPPFGVNLDAGGKQEITLDTVTLKLDKRWYQLYTAATPAELLEGKIGRWNQVTKAVYEANENLAAGAPAKLPARIVNYQPGWVIHPHAVSYNAVLERVNALYPLRGGYVTYSDLSQPFMQRLELTQPSQPTAVVPGIAEDADVQTFTFPLTGLTQNTAYLTWVTVENAQGYFSDPSDPLVVTTLPQDGEVVTIPVVPNFISALAGDNFVDLTWQAVDGMDYDISWGTSEDRDEALGTETVHEADYTLRSFFRLENLTPETRYNLWIRAINTELNATGGAIGVASAWSGAFAVKTEPWLPPATPTGFGVKSGESGITADAITYEWVVLPDVEYRLEFADNAAFSRAKNITVKDGSHTMTGLISNRRYHARLFAVSPKSGLSSTPTATVIVVTDRSRNDYDSSYDLDDIPSGDELLYGQVGTDGTWTTKSVGVNAYRLAESIRDLGEPVVQIDLRSPPAGVRTVRLELGSAVYDTLSALKMDLLVRTPGSDWTVRPGALQNDRYFSVRADAPDMTIRFDIRSPATEYRATGGIALKTPVTDLKVTAGAGDRYSALTEFARPLQVSLPVPSLTAYRRDEISLRTWAAPGVWTKRESRLDYEAGRVLADLVSTAPVAAVVRAAPVASSMPAYVKSSLDAIARQYDLKALDGSGWKASTNLTGEMLAKLMLDVIPYDWTKANPLTTASRAGFVRSADLAALAAGGAVRREQAIAAVVAMYGKKSGEKPLAVDRTAWADFTDWSGVDAAYLNGVRFAVENGIVQGSGTGKLNPNAAMNVGDFLVLMERCLTVSGDL